MSYLVDVSVSIIIPMCNRRKFGKKVEHNILTQDYLFIKGMIIGDDYDIDKRISRYSIYD